MSPRNSKSSVAIVEGDAEQRRQIAASLRTEFNTLEAEDYMAAYQLLREEQPDILLLDLPESRGGIRDGVEMIREIGRSPLDTIVIVMSDSPLKSTALKVMEAGAYDYFVKPVDLDVLRVILRRAVEKQELERENQILREEFYRQRSFGDLVGSSVPMQQVYEAIRKVADSNATVIIRGESGTGKELVARSIHEHSPRAAQPFISVNCAALPETLMEAELFGYEKGAFTGATATKEGRIELAHRGTLFLDEIGTLTPALQSKLLRVLEEHTLVRLGGKKPIKVDFRLFTATNVDLEKLVRESSFREDLYYRIHVVPIYIPPLRERVEDISLLANYFLRVHCAANGLPLKRVDENTMRALEQRPWHGNVRELENVVQRMVLMSDSNAITLKHLPSEWNASGASPGDHSFQISAEGMRLDEAVESYERKWLEAALAQARGVKAQAARLLGLDRDRMKYLCRKHGL